MRRAQAADRPETHLLGARRGKRLCHRARGVNGQHLCWSPGCSFCGPDVSCMAESYMEGYMDMAVQLLTMLCCSEF